MDKIQWWNDDSIEVVEINGRMIALDGWNGNIWAHCWEVEEILDHFAYGIKEEHLIVTPKFSESTKTIRYSISGNKEKNRHE